MIASSAAGRPNVSGRAPGWTPGPRSTIAPVALPFEIMGVVNVTPDSFSDGGEWFERDAAVAHGRLLAAEGAAIVDVGGESTRPHALPVAEDEELRRTEPVVR